MKRAHSQNGTPIIGIAGWKKSGKTTLTVRLVEEMTRRGYRVATVKHAHHNFQIDDKETDSARHRRAGAREVAIVSRDRWAIVGELDGAGEPDFADVIGWLSPCDLIIVEGYKSAPIPKIEARRRASFDHRPLSKEDTGVIAIAADHVPEGESVPLFDLDDVAAIADFILAATGAGKPPAAKPARRRRPAKVKA
jgi:molybdopterin-guanine dinucleotide biosynthesis protein B